MNIGDVLHALMEEVTSFCDTNTKLYMLLFADDNSNDTSLYENIAKKRFAGQSLKKDIQAHYCQEANFNDFCEKIKLKYLTRANDHSMIYKKLRNLVEECSYFPENHKKILLSSCDPANRFQLARFIAACILCGSYHSSLAEKGISDIRYTFNIDFMKLDIEEKEFPLMQRIWEAEQQAFLFSRREGSRFFDLDIIEKLLPHGYVTESNFQLRARSEDGEIRPLMDICKENDHQHIAVTGEGGIGKTTFLQQLLQEEFWDANKNPTTYKSGRPVPIFIELRQCPAQIQNWYEKKYRKTNFITRYIAQLLENHRSLDDVSTDTLIAIEKELQRTPKDGIPKYLLLLDGFNEISVSRKGDSYSCRALLSNEISTIRNEYPNVRIIATSRETQAAYFTSSFQNVYLIGLEENDIKEHLKQRNFSDTVINITIDNKPLMRCLKVPLFLCMFSYEFSEKNKRLPETRGEILYYFFHGNSTFYNLRNRATDTLTNPLNELQTALILDFILPYIGWTLERNDTFSLSENALKNCINESLDILKYMFLETDSIPFEDFQYDPELFAITCDSLKSMDNVTTKIISCAFDYLGILYQYIAPEKDVKERRQYSFIHHYFRDYFSSIFDIQLLRMLPHIEASSFINTALENSNYTYNHFLNSFYWNQSKKELISQILMEHRNKPTLNHATQFWHVPNMETDEQKVLSQAIDFCRELKKICPTHYLLRNILSAVVYGRQELSGMNLSDLDFTHCNIFSIPCSKQGTKNTLAANFDNSILPNDFLEPDDHVNSIEEYAYSGQHCFTLDLSGTIKCWDILSGCVEYILQSGDPNGMMDYSPNGYMKISADGHWLAAKVYNNKPTGDIPPTCLYVFDLHNPEEKPLIMQTEKSHTTITSFSFTDDNKHILYLADQRELYCFRIEDASMRYYQHFNSFFKHTELYAADDHSDIYAFSGEYDNFDSADFYPEYEDEEKYETEWDDKLYDSDDEWDNSYMPIPCILCRCNPIDASAETLYSFTSVPGTYPVSRYFPMQNCFLLFNEENGQLERFSCITNTAEVVYEELTLENDNTTPSSIQYCPERPNECYIIYPKQSYNVSLNTNNQNSILMKYNLSALNELLNDDDEMEDLLFYPNIIPSWNRFIIRNSENTYEWDTVNDTLLHRYNTKLYESRDLIYDKLHSLGILVHQFNGVSIFSGNPLKLSNSICYPNPEYYAGGCCYHEKTMQLAIMFCKASHEYVEIINLQTGEREIIYSTLTAYETLESIQFHPNGNYLLITLGNSCLEYDCTKKECYKIDTAGENELYIDGCYTDTASPQIQIAIVEHFNYDEPHIEPHCDFYSIHHTPKDNSYRKEWRYYMPTLTRETAKNFLHYSYDIGSGASYTKEEYQTYWCTNGFFLHNFPDDEAFQNIRCSKFNKNRELPLQKSFDKLQMIFCRHDFALANQYRTEKACNNYAYCSDDFSEVIEIFDHSQITYWKNLHTTPSSSRYVYDDGENTSDEMSYVSWDTVIPWNKEMLLACYEQYHLIQIKQKGNGISKEIPYKPAISIHGCSFRNVNASQELLENLKNNGAIL